MKKSYKIYGVNGHRQKVSFISSTNFIDGHGAKIELMTADKINTHDFVIMNIEANTAEQIDAAFLGQLSDGIFENARIGRIEEI